MQRLHGASVLPGCSAARRAQVVRSKKLLASVGLPEVARLQRVLFDALCEHQVRGLVEGLRMLSG